MSFPSRRITLIPAAVICVFGLVMSPVMTNAQEFPTKPIRIIVPSSPGVPQEFVVRVVSGEMARVLGQPVIFEYKPGADQLIGLEYVARQAPADGHTLLATAVGSLASLPVTAKALRFDPLKELIPVIALAETRFVLVSSATVPWQTIGELITHARANPGKLNFGASNSNVRLIAEAVIRNNNLNVTFIPYATGGAYIQAVLTGEVHMGVLSEAALVPIAARLRPLAVSGTERRPPYMGVPTFAELGNSSIRGASYSLNAAVATPRPIVEKLHSTITKILQTADVRERFAKLQMVVINESPEVSAAKLADEARFFAEIAKKAGM